MVDRQAVEGTTGLVGLLGHPVAHSISPAIHNHAFASLGLPYAYVPLDVPPHDLPAAVQALRVLRFVGANVTIPHKRAVAASCDRLSELSRLTGTVNTLYMRDGDLCGTTTDPDGFFRALASMGHDSRAGHVVILGNGGAARTLATALAHKGKIASLALIGRDPGRVAGLADEVSLTTGFDVASALFDSSGCRDRLAACTLLVNCTSVGMYPNTNASPLPASAFHSGMTVFDTIYNPCRTVLLQHAEKAGCVIQNGLRMLLFQGLASFAYWTGVEAPEELFDIRELQSLVTEQTPDISSAK